MPVFAQPWWLVALGIIPLIRWWHRRQAPLSTVTVSAIFLWPRNAVVDDAGSTPTPPDPAWRRRALIGAAFIMVLAGPSIDREHNNITVWIDDSPSMQAIESGISRADSAERLLALELENTGQVEVRRQLLTRPYPSRLDQRSAHWLLSDGASELVRDWAEGIKPDRVIQVGTATENSAITGLAARRSLEEDGVFDVLISVRNSGFDVDERGLQLWSGDELLETSIVSIGPMQLTHSQFRIRPKNVPLVANLSPGDALSSDDRLEISAALLQAVKVAIDNECSAQLRSALESHPALDSAKSEGGAALLVTCSVDGPTNSETDDKAHIHVIRGNSIALTSEPVWVPFEGSSGKLRLPLNYLRATQWPGGTDNDSRQVVLRSDTRPLILATQMDDGKSRLVETVIDMGHREFGQQAEYAGLVATLVDAALGDKMLSAVTRESRDIADTSIQPNDIAFDSNRPAQQARSAAIPLSGPLLLLASILIGLDILLLYRSRRRASHV